MSLVKAYALFTINEHSWLTRAVAVVDGEVRRLAPSFENGERLGTQRVPGRRRSPRPYRPYSVSRDWPDAPLT
jgi:hypothetical protein